jgi:hypothetical protein
MRRPKVTHEVRCPVHGFIEFNNLERRLIDSAPLQPPIVEKGAGVWTPPRV